MSVVATLSDVGHQGKSVTGTRPQIQEVSAVIYTCSGLVYACWSVHLYIYMYAYICIVFICMFHT